MGTRVKFTLVASKSHGHACDQELRLTGSHWGATLLDLTRKERTKPTQSRMLSRIVS